MTSDSVTVHVASDVAGWMLRCSQAALESSQPTLSMYDHKGTCFAASEQGKVHMVAAPESGDDAVVRECVGVIDHKSGTMTIHPAAAHQVVRLRERLADRAYDAPATDLKDAEKSKRSRTTELVQAFGSTRRARLLGQRAVTQALENNVVGRAEVEEAIANLGHEAEAAGLTTEMVMNRLAETRNIPPHNPQATTAAEAYQISEIITTADKRHLLHDRFAEALKSPANLQALEDDKIWGGLDPFVRYMLRTKQDEGLLPTRQKDCSQWLALYHVCQKLMKMRVGVVLEETVTPLEGSAGEEASDEEEEDPFAVKERVTNLGNFATRNAFTSPAAVVHFAEKFGSLRHHPRGMQYQRSDQQKQLLQTTLAVCAIRCNENKLSVEMGRALLKSFQRWNDVGPNDVTSWMRQIGCKVTALKQYVEGTAFTAQLLTAIKNPKPLCDVLPAIKVRKGKRKT